MKIALGLVMLFVAGCGGVIYAAERDSKARQACADYGNDGAEFDVIVIAVESIRDDGVSKADYIAAAAQTCEGQAESCFTCTVFIGDLVY